MFDQLNQEKLLAAGPDNFSLQNIEDFDGLALSLQANIANSGDMHIMTMAQDNTIKNNFLNELRILICGAKDGEDDPYTKVREKFGDLINTGYDILLKVIATAMAAMLGLDPTFLSPFIKTALIIVIRMGKNLACRFLI